MSKVVLTDLEFEVPNNWQDQGMVTLTIPSTDKNVRPNIIITKERLAQPVDLATYFAKIKEAVQARGIQTFKILDEREIKVGGVPAMQMVCSWDLEAMKQMLGDNPEALKNIKPGQKVQQIQVSLIKGEVAVNLTASFPAEQFELYSRPFQKFLGTIKAA
jgi:hypothetical protein